jgi:hypothetical protein
MRTRAATALVALCLLPAFIFLIGPADAAASDKCSKVFERYQLGVTPQTLTPLRRYSALYVYRKRDGNCGWATVNNVASAGEARTAGYRKCKGIENNAVVHCTLIGVNGRILAGAKRFAPDFVATVAAAPARVAQSSGGDRWLPGEPRYVGFVRPVRLSGVSCNLHPADADRRQCEDYYCIRPVKEGRPANPYWCSHLKGSQRASRSD